MKKTAAEYQKEYRKRLKERAAAGDKQALQVIETERANKRFRGAKNFIKNHATVAQARELRELTLDREKELKEKK